MTREELLNRMSSRELTDWQALYILEAEEREKARKEAALERRRR